MRAPVREDDEWLQVGTTEYLDAKSKDPSPQMPATAQQAPHPQADDSFAADDLLDTVA
jgi:hypothetical protein